MQTQAQAVIAGSGIAGASIAYHLAELGWRDVAVLEQGALRSGTTSHAPGLIGQLRSSATLSRMLMHSVSLYRQLDAGRDPGFSQVGSLRLAASKARWEQLKRQQAFAHGLGLPAELISVNETKRLFPLLESNGLAGALYLPTDGSARATVLAQALTEAAQKRGAIFYPETRIIGFELDRGRVKAVQTNRGRVETAVFVLAAGIWSPRIGRLAGIAVPLAPIQHQYVMTEPLAELAGTITVPNLRAPDHLVYFRQDSDSLVLGGYERDPRTFEVDAIPDSANPTVRPFDAPRFAPLLTSGGQIVPRLRDLKLIKQVNGLESFTPDGEFLLGESPEVGGFWMACGFCAHGVSGAGGVGKVLAEWIVTGKPGLDCRAMDVRRFAGRRLSPDETARGAVQVYATYYDLRANERG